MEFKDLLEGKKLIIQNAKFEYKILWADEDLGQGADHLNFKLSNSGEAVGLYQAIGENIHMIDEYARHLGHADMVREAIDGVTGE